MIKSQIKINTDKIWQFQDETQVSSVFGIKKQLSMQRQGVLMTPCWLVHKDNIFSGGRAQEIRNNVNKRLR